MNAEQLRVQRNSRGEEAWDLWGPYLSDRAWGTVREDYSADGDAWAYFPHEQARSRAYRWNEDGIGGISDSKQRLCFAFAFWNERDPFLKERLFGLSGPEGNHGDDVKEVFFYEDNIPSHSYMRMTYRYPQTAFPYAELVHANAQRSKVESEFELAETGVFAKGFFEIAIEYAKQSPEDILIRARVMNRSDQAAILHVLPTLWFRNTWSWGRDERKPSLRALAECKDNACIAASHHGIGDYQLYCAGADELFFTENETNLELLWGVPNESRFVKDGIGNRVIHGREEAVNPDYVGTKAAAHCRLDLGAGETGEVRLRLQQVAKAGGGSSLEPPRRFRAAEKKTETCAVLEKPFADFEQIFAQRVAEADEFYQALAPPALSEEHRRIQRQSLAGLLWSKQFYHFIVEHWLEGDPAQPRRLTSANAAGTRSGVIFTTSG